MRVLYRAMVLSTLVVAAACGHKDNRDAFRSSDDLLLPNGNAVASPTELGLTDSVPAVPVAKAAPAPAPERVASRSTRSTSRRSSGGYYPARQPVVVRHTKRDAIVGAAAGAAIGATVDRNRVRGAVIGGVLGGVLGGVVGNKVDVTKKY